MAHGQIDSRRAASAPPPPPPPQPPTSPRPPPSKRYLAAAMMRAKSTVRQDAVRQDDTTSKHSKEGAKFGVPKQRIETCTETSTGQWRCALRSPTSPSPATATRTVLWIYAHVRRPGLVPSTVSARVTGTLECVSARAGMRRRKNVWTETQGWLQARKGH